MDRVRLIPYLDDPLPVTYMGEELPVERCWKLYFSSALKIRNLMDRSIFFGQIAVCMYEFREVGM